jgi:hypothetical protein
MVKWMAEPDVSASITIFIIGDVLNISAPQFGI